MNTAMTILRPEKLEIEGLTKVYGRRGREVLAIDGIDLKVSDGEIVCIVGASGCGKSTLLSIVAGLETPTSGRVEVDGEPVVGPGPDRGMVFQAYSLFPWKTVAQNVAFGLELSGAPRGERAERVAALLETMKLTAAADRLPRELSGGMSQRVAIARALAPKPDIMLLDEPFGALDAQTKRAMQDYLLEVWREVSPTILMVTHDVEEAVYLASRVYVLSTHPGRVAAEIAVPFGADRDRGLKRDPQFLDVCDQVQDLLADEALVA